jgi:hypothetical protein
MFSRRKAFLERGYVGGLRVFVPSLGLVGDLGAVAKVPIAARVDGRLMDEDVLRAVIRG